MSGERTKHQWHDPLGAVGILRPPETRLDSFVESRISELQAYQVELELQNSALREAKRALEASVDRYADLYDFAPIAYFVFDGSGTVCAMNLAAETLLQCERATAIGKPLTSLVTIHDPASFLAHLRHCLEMRTSLRSALAFIEETGWLDIQAVSTPILGPGLCATACRTAFLDISEQRASERQLAHLHEREKQRCARLEAIDRASIALAKGLATRPVGNLKDFLQIIVDEARVVANAEYAALGVGEPGEELLSVFSGAPREEAALENHALQPSSLSKSAALAGERTRLRDLREHLASRGLPTHEIRTASFLGMPIRQGEAIRGNLYVANKVGAGEFSDQDRATIEALVDRLGVALESARLQKIEERERSSLNFLAAAGTAFAESIDYDTTLETVVRVVVPEMADFCLLHVRNEDGVFRRAAVHHAEFEKRTLLTEFPDLIEGSSLPSWIDEVLRSKKPRRRTLSQQDLEDFATSPAYGPSFRALSPRVLLAVPLVLRDEVVGLLQLGMAESGRTYRDDDLYLAQNVAHHAMLGIQAALLHRATQGAVLARDSLFRLVSHDLTNYLNAVVVATEFLARQAAAMKEGLDQTSVDSIRSAVRGMVQLISSLRDATMVETGQFAIRPRPEAPNTLVRNSVTVVGPQIEAASLRLEVDLAEGLPDVFCDRDRVVQVFVNLIGNALKFVSEGAIRIEGERDGSTVRFAVADQGPGIAEHDRCHLFERYWKGECATQQGTGLGLYIARGIVEAHGGTIWVESTVGRGTTFYFTLPIDPAGARS